MMTGWPTIAGLKPDESRDEIRNVPSRTRQEITRPVPGITQQERAFGDVTVAEVGETPTIMCF